MVLEYSSDYMLQTARIALHNGDCHTYRTTCANRVVLANCLPALRLASRVESTDILALT